MVKEASQLAKKVKEFLQDKNAVEACCAKALQVIKNSDNIAQKIVEKINQVLVEASKKNDEQTS